MDYLITQMLPYLVIAATIGFLSAWLIRGGLAKEEKRSFGRQLAANELAYEKLQTQLTPTDKAFAGEVVHLHQHPRRADQPLRTALGARAHRVGRRWLPTVGSALHAGQCRDCRTHHLINTCAALQIAG